MAETRVVWSDAVEVVEGMETYSEQPGTTRVVIKGQVAAEGKVARRLQTLICCTRFGTGGEMQQTYPPPSPLPNPPLARQARQHKGHRSSLSCSEWPARRKGQWRAVNEAQISKRAHVGADGPSNCAVIAAPQVQT
jgi:hypothetical protein